MHPANLWDQQRSIGSREGAAPQARKRKPEKERRISSDRDRELTESRDKLASLAPNSTTKMEDSRC
jgi:hypothetical protein